MGRVFKQTHPPSSTTIQPSDFFGLSSVPSKLRPPLSVPGKVGDVYFFHLGVSIKKTHQVGNNPDGTPFRPWRVKVPSSLASHFPGISPGHPISVPCILAEAIEGVGRSVTIIDNPLMMQNNPVHIRRRVELKVVSSVIHSIVQNSGQVESITAITKNGSRYEITLLLE